MAVDFSPHIDTMFLIHGVYATYVHGSDDPITIKVIAYQPDEIEGVPGSITQTKASTALFDVRKSDITNPAAGDAIIMEGVEYTIIHEPVVRDADRLIWTISVVEFGS